MLINYKIENDKPIVICLNMHIFTGPFTTLVFTYIGDYTLDLEAASLGSYC